jgi:hypothetical protein
MTSALEWVDVTQFLPAFNQRVLVWRIGVVSSLLTSRADIDKLLSIGGEARWSSEIGTLSFYRVTHWKELPPGPVFPIKQTAT